MVAINVRADLRSLQRATIALQAKQVPFATALMLTSLAKGAQALEVQDISDTFDRPTPFTQRSVAVMAATKSNQVARVYIRPIAAAYLEPYVDSGQHFLGNKRGLLVPKNVQLNAYGNLARGKLKSLKGKPGIYVGAVKTRNGVVRGVWQRPTSAKAGRSGKRRGIRVSTRTALKLLIRFDDPQPVREHLDFYGRVESYVRRNAANAFDTAMRKALATAR